MSHVHFHAESSARQFGGEASHYTDYHAWFDATKIAWCDPRHRALRHHVEAIPWLEADHGPGPYFSRDHVVKAADIAVQHLREDCGGRIPSVTDWFENLPCPDFFTPCNPIPGLIERFGGGYGTYNNLVIYMTNPVPRARLAAHANHALRCHAFGVFEAEQRLGPLLDIHGARPQPTRVVAERIVAACCGGRVPSVADWLGALPKQRWMNAGYRAAAIGQPTARAA